MFGKRKSWADARADVIEAKAAKARAGMPAGAPEVMVRTYATAGGFRRETRTMMASGWELAGQESHRGRIVATWTRKAPAAPAE